MNSDGIDLVSLERIMSEIYGGRVAQNDIGLLQNNLDQAMIDLVDTPGIWKSCVQCLGRTENQYLLNFLLSVLENIIQKKWLQMSQSARTEMRELLHSYLNANHCNAPKFLVNKLGKLIVYMARYDWPHDYPNFFDSILQLSQNPDTVLVGLMMINTTYSGLMTKVDGLPVARRENIKDLLLDQVPNVLNVLLGYLDAVLDEHFHVKSSLPSVDCITDSQQNTLSPPSVPSGNIFGNTEDISASSKNGPFCGFKCNSLLDSKTKEICSLSLKCLSQLFSWIPLSMYMTLPILRTIFHYVSFGCDPKHSDCKDGSVDKNNVFHNASEDSCTDNIQGMPMSDAMHVTQAVLPQNCIPSDNTDLAIPALVCLNEITSKNYIPAEFEEHMLLIFQATAVLLQHTTKSTDDSKNVASSKNKLDDMDENFIQSFTEYLRLLFANHLRRIERNPNFNVIEFLSMFFKYTFQQPTPDKYYACLEIWHFFLEFLNSKLDPERREEKLVRYWSILSGLLTEVFQKFQFQYNQSMLEELDDEYLDDDYETEWQRYLHQCLEIVSKICDLMPEEVFKCVCDLFSHNLTIYMGLAQFVENVDGSAECSLNITGENDCRRLHCSLRDLSSSLQAVGRLVEHMIGCNFSKHKDLAYQTLEKLCMAADYSNQGRFYDMQTEASSVLQSDFTDVHAQLLATLNTFCCQWLVPYSREQAGLQLYCTTNSFAYGMAAAAVHNIGRGIPLKVIQSSAQLFFTVTSAIRPHFLYQHPEITNLLDSACSQKLKFLPDDVQSLVYKSLSNMMILPWTYGSESPESWVSRTMQHTQLIRAFVASLLMSEHSENILNEDPMLVNTEVAWCIQNLTVLLDNIIDTPQRTRVTFYNSLIEVMPTIQWHFYVFSNRSKIMKEILNFYIAYFTVLKSQIPLSFLEKTIQDILNLYTKEEFIQFLVDDGPEGCNVLKRLLVLLRFIIQEHGPNSKSILPSTLQLCVEQIFPRISTHNYNYDVINELYNLLHAILVFQWRYFFKKQVTNFQNANNQEHVENADAFIKIMETFAYCMTRPDFHLLKRSLEVLEDVNNKCKLYHKGIFRTLMMDDFLKHLLVNLFNKSHSMIEEEIVIAIYNMASVDFDYFFISFLPRFLNSYDSLDNSLKRCLLERLPYETDVPTFMENLRDFVSDFQFYSNSCNSTA